MSDTAVAYARFFEQSIELLLHTLTKVMNTDQYYRMCYRMACRQLGVEKLDSFGMQGFSYDPGKYGITYKGYWTRGEESGDIDLFISFRHIHNLQFNEGLGEVKHF